MPLSHIQKMKFSPELKKLLDQNNISEKGCDKKLTMLLRSFYVTIDMSKKPLNGDFFPISGS